MARPEQDIEDPDERPVVVLGHVRLHPCERVQVPPALGAQVVHHPHRTDTLGRT